MVVHCQLYLVVLLTMIVAAWEVGSQGVESILVSPRVRLTRMGLLEIYSSACIVTLWYRVPNFSVIRSCFHTKACSDEG